MQPLGDKILVKQIVESKVTESGIILDTVKNQYEKVEVISVSPDTQTILKAGDICLSAPGGIELEDGIWLRNEKLLHCKL
jgi:co-chaperonin GroES (HSP10)